MLAIIRFRMFFIPVSSLELKNKIYRSIILHVVLYGCETRLKMLKNRLLGRIFGPKRDEVMQGWRKLHSEELYNLHSSLKIINMMKSRMIWWMRHITYIWEMRNIQNCSWKT